MEYQGQLIYRFDSEQDIEFIRQQTAGLVRFGRTIFGLLLAAVVIVAIVQIPVFTWRDYGALAVFASFLLILYYRMSRSLANMDSDDLEDFKEQLIFYEYGIEFPQLSRRDNDRIDDDLFDSDYIPYNEITSITVDDDFVIFSTKSAEFEINLTYFPFYSAESANYEEQRQLFVSIVKRISQNLANVENREHPTVIPKSYFRDLLSSEQ